MSNIIATPSSKKRDLKCFSSYADQKKWISREFYQALNEFTELDDGSQVTKIQAAIRSVVDSMVDPECDPYYRLSALKFVTEHIEGKATAMKDEHHEDMPKFAIVVGDATASQIKKAVEKINPPEVPEEEYSQQEDDCYVSISNEDGSDKEELIV